MLTMLLGGARAGKSTLAERWGREHHGEVAVIATGEPFDDEMATRIERHRGDRPAGWRVIEEPVDLTGAIGAAPTDAFLIVDCLTTWLGNLTFRDLTVDPEPALEALAARTGPAVVISNEVGWGIVPADPDTRAYRDALGRLNQRFVDAADAAYLVVAGRVVRLEEAS